MSFVPYRWRRHAEQEINRQPMTTSSVIVENIGYRPMFQNHETAPLMTSIAELLTQKQSLLGRLEEEPGPNERCEIERLLRKVDAELNAVDRPDRL